MIIFYQRCAEAGIAEFKTNDLGNLNLPREQLQDMQRKLPKVDMRDVTEEEKGIWRAVTTTVDTHLSLYRRCDEAEIVKFMMQDLENLPLEQLQDMQRKLPYVDMADATHEEWLTYHSITEDVMTFIAQRDAMIQVPLAHMEPATYTLRSVGTKIVDTIKGLAQSASDAVTFSIMTDIVIDLSRIAQKLIMQLLEFKEHPDLIQQYSDQLVGLRRNYLTNSARSLPDLQSVNFKMENLVNILRKRVTEMRENARNEARRIEL